MANDIIMLVEDNPDDEALTIRALQRNNISNEVFVARDGVEAMDYVFAKGTHADRDADDLPRLVLLDLKLPKADGLEVLKQIRANERTKRLPVVVLTSSKEDQDVVDSYNLGVNSYIRKPVDFTLFTEAVRQVGLYWLVLNEPPPRYEGGRMSTPLRVLIVEDQEDDAALMLRELRRAQFEPEYERVETEDELTSALGQGGWDIVLSDHGLPRFNSLQALNMVHESGLDVPFIIVSGSIGEDLAVAAMKSGAHDYIMKNNLARLGPVVERELREAETRRARRAAEEERQGLIQELEQAYTQLERRVRQITASIMFTDLQDSTQMLTRLGDEENQTLLASHSRIIREKLEEHGGLEVKTIGDGFMIAFYSARKAVTCAVDIQKELQEFNLQNPDRQLKVRIGLNLGEVIKEDEDYFGSAVVMAARIMDESTGGQILVSDLLRQVAEEPSHSEHQYSDFGRHTLKGFDYEEQIFEVLWEPSAA